MDVFTFFIQGLLCNAVAANGIEQRKFELIFRGIQVNKQVINFVQHFVWTGVFSIDFVDHHHDLQSGLKGLFENKTRLGQRTFRGVYQQQGAVGHG